MHSSDVYNLCNLELQQSFSRESCQATRRSRISPAMCHVLFYRKSNQVERDDTGRLDSNKTISLKFYRVFSR